MPVKDRSKSSALRSVAMASSTPDARPAAIAATSRRDVAPTPGAAATQPVTRATFDEVMVPCFAPAPFQHGLHGLIQKRVALTGLIRGHSVPFNRKGSREAG